MQATTNDRYELDDRIRCIAIIDTFHPSYADVKPGRERLDRLSPYVVAFNTIDDHHQLQGSTRESNLILHSDAITLHETMQKHCDELNDANTITPKDIHQAMYAMMETRNAYRSLFNYATT